MHYIVILENIDLQMHIGITAEERQNAQLVVVTCVISKGEKPDACSSDSVADSIDYCDVLAIVERCAMREYHTLEKFLDEIHQRLCELTDHVAVVDVSAQKPDILPRDICPTVQLIH